ncbi:PQQ-dependent sugar dehydrogenase [Herbiconiux sp. YIM B11900]|uniref:PQQ-dependent sugar dehydrogenase n=1 Tax=Herbiconiux sp. YIM B11900 TaxID=3404131 RepID=UPI003F859DCF
MDRPLRLRAAGGALTTAVLVGVLTACAATPAEAPTTTASAVPTPSDTASATPTAPATGTPAPSPAADLGPLVPSGDPVPIAGGLEAPWSIAQLTDGTIFVSERDTARVLEIVGGQAVPVFTMPDVTPSGEGGLLGLATLELDTGSYLYAYFTADEGNRVVRVPIGGAAGSHTFGAVETVLTGIPKASNHNGGRIAFGPDGMLYITTGDASTTSNAQTLDSLGGKILRVTEIGGVPADNPFPGSPVYTLGHRNPQGISWAPDGTMWAAEFGQDTWDELNRITPGANYGWPVVEGLGGSPSYVDPVVQWPTDDASPSGIVVVGSTVFLAGLGGERLWTASFEGAAAEWYGGGQLGRIRDVVRGPGASVYLITNNTDGRGSPREGGDVLYQVNLVPAG